MKSAAILDMVRREFDWYHRAVEVNFVSVIGNEYTFQVCHDHPYDNDQPINLKITVKVEAV